MLASENDSIYAIFVNDYSGSKYCEKMGEYQFDKNSKSFAINIAGMMLNYADFNV